MAPNNLFLFVILSTVTLVFSKSFTVVLDTTQSMDLEIDVIKRNVQTITDILANKTEFENYILVPFNDADDISPMVTTKPNQMMDFLSNLRVSEGSECPEDSLSAIHKALQISQQQSYIYLFTNASAKYNGRLRDIENLCRDTGSRVIIFLSGSCSADSPGGAGYLDVYYNIARSCSGSVFKMAAVNLNKAFKYIKETTSMEYNDVVNYEAFRGLMQFTFTVDSLTTDILIVVSGEYPVLQIADADGYSPDMLRMVDTRQSLVIRISNLKAGVYHTAARSKGTAYLTLCKRNKLQFEYGFSTRMPNSLMETSPRPIPGRNNYIFIQLRFTEHIIMNEVELKYVGSDLKKRVILQKINNRPGCYCAVIMIEAQKHFRMTIIGKDEKTYHDVLGSTKIIEVQNSNQESKWFAPTTEILKPDTNLIDYGTNATVVCKVAGYPKPTIWWEDDKDNTLSSEDVLLEIPSVHLSYVNIDRMSSNFTLYCKATNAQSSDVSSIELFVNRPYTFEVLQAPSDQEIEYGESGKLFCNVDAYPVADIQWYHNETHLEYNYNKEFDYEEKALLIKNMTLNDAGNYTCEVTNEANKVLLSAMVTIGGLEAPQIRLPDEIKRKPEDWVEIECSLEKGNPQPEISWEYRPNNEDEFQETMPSEVFVEDTNKLKFSSVKVEHNGSYKCTAVNMLGEDSAVVNLKVQYAPKISNSDNTTVVVTELNNVELPCEVDAIPEARVKWEMYQDDVIISLDGRHTTDDKNTHKFIALKQDSGTYYCIAENELGIAKKTVTVNVLVPPYIEEPVSSDVTATVGSSVKFECNVLYGNPVPTTMWEFIAVDSTASVLLRGISNTTTLHLHQVTKANEGLYLCIAENEVRNDRIRIRLRVL